MTTLTNQNQGDPSPPWWRILPWLGHWSGQRHRRAVEDLLKHIHACQRRNQAASSESAAGAIGWSPRRAVKVIASVEAKGYIRSTPRGLELTDEGTQIAINVIRAHRLWERYLADEAGMPLTKVHAEANRREHHREDGRVDRLDAALGYPQSDPHGDPIPTADGQLAEFAGTPLMTWQTGQPARITHIEDEPPSVFDKIAAVGLLPGQVITTVSSTPQGLRVKFDNKEALLAPVIAANIFVQPLPQDTTTPAPTRSLSSLTQGNQAVIRGLDQGLRGFHRRRLLDLGLTPGTPIRAERVSMFRDPKAYRVRGSLVALRREQADKVLIEDAPTQTPHTANANQQADP
jgi:DtxR family transcriptional regulator, Mn-dependent transcriptional regulator